MLLAIFSTCCQHDAETQLTCTDAALAANDMAPYTGQDTGCSLFLMEYVYEEESYYVLGNHCADMLVYPMNCDNQPLCGEDNPALCTHFFTNATYLGIVGIRL